MINMSSPTNQVQFGRKPDLGKVKRFVERDTTGVFKKDSPLPDSNNTKLFEKPPSGLSAMWSAAKETLNIRGQLKKDSKSTTYMAIRNPSPQASNPSAWQSKDYTVESHSTPSNPGERASQVFANIVDRGFLRSAGAKPTGRGSKGFVASKPLPNTKLWDTRRYKEGNTSTGSFYGVMAHTIEEAHPNYTAPATTTISETATPYTPEAFTSSSRPRTASH
jgi:hypothetical protein